MIFSDKFIYKFIAIILIFLSISSMIILKAAMLILNGGLQDGTSNDFEYYKLYGSYFAVQ